jgi:WD40 repeat protein
LLFLSQGKLSRWDHVTDYIGVLAEEVVDYSVSADGKAIAMLRAKNFTANGVEQFKLDLLDFETKQITTLLDHTPRLYKMSISPDARWTVFSYQEKPGTIYALQTDRATKLTTSEQSDRSPVEMGPCKTTDDTTCLGMTWSPDSQALMWGDSFGIWISTLATRKPLLIQSNDVTISDPQNVTNQIEVTFLSLDWSPAGRFAMLTVAPTSSHVSWQAVLDTLTGRLVQVPDSYKIDARESSVTWMENGDLLVLHASNPTEQRPPFVNIYQVLPTSNELLVSIIDFELQGIELPIKSPSIKIPSILYLSWPNLLDPRTLILGSTTTGISYNPALLSIDLEFKKFDRLLELPEDISEILWSPDGQNALILGSNNQIQFLTLPGGSLRDLSAVLSEHAHDFFWLPPVPRF